MSEQLVVVGDVHGQLALAEAVRAQYSEVDHIVFAGDVVDGPDVKGVLEVIKTLGATVVLGNHEQYLLGAMLEANEDQRRDLVDMWAQVHQGTLESYSLYAGPTPAAALQLRDKMEKLGHLALLQNGPLYFENDELVVIHGDVTTDPWQSQRVMLEAEKRRNLSGGYWGWSEDYLMPPQLGEDQHEVEPGNLTASGLTKQLLSGHFHVANRDTDGRYFNDGQHLLLPGSPRHGFTYAYESWTKQLRLIEAN